VPLLILAEVAICACDLAKVIGAAVALQLLFDLQPST
jgi:Mn2+/Fe2+ NRAMP family transporter